MKKPNRKKEKKLIKKGYKLIAGIDEAGKGAWAGPLVAAAVILPETHKIKGINDSKKLTPIQREKLYVKIIKSALSWTVHLVDHKKIEKWGIVQANIKVMQKLIEKINIKPEYILVDALKINFQKIPSESFIKGDEKIISIAAASIIAKVTRDRLMIGEHRRYPKYKFYHHKGYGTAMHHKLIKKHGLSPIHRRSFLPMKRYIKKKRRKRSK